MRKRRRNGGAAAATLVDQRLLALLLAHFELKRLGGDASLVLGVVGCLLGAARLRLGGVVSGIGRRVLLLLLLLCVVVDVFVLGGRVLSLLLVLSLSLSV